MGIGYIALSLITYHVSTHEWDNGNKFNAIWLGLGALIEFVIGIMLIVGEQL